MEETKQKLSQVIAMQLNDGTKEEEVYKALSLIESELSIELTTQDYAHDYLTINEGRSGKMILWYYDGECDKECAVYIATNKKLSSVQIDKELM